jgi:hypothetical protein
MRLRTLPCAALLSFALATVGSAQMTVHVVAGVVKSASASLLSVATDNGADTSAFRLESTGTPRLNFPKDLEAATTPAGSFHTVGDSVLLYYYGFGDERTAAAVRDLGASPFTKAQGTVTAYDRHERSLTLTSDGGKELSLVLDPGVVIDADTGVESGKKFVPHKGDHLRVIYGGGSPATVVLLGEML